MFIFGEKKHKEKLIVLINTELQILGILSNLFLHIKVILTTKTSSYLNVRNS